MIFIESINTEKGLATTRGKVEKYLKLLTMFLKDLEQKMPDMQDALANNDIARYTTAVHAIRSASAYIGADELSAASHQMETAGKNNDLAYIVANKDAYADNLEKIKASIKNAIAAAKEV